MAWFLLVIAGMLEVVWAVALKQSAAFTRLGPSLLALVAMVGSIWLLAISMRSLPLGTAYAVWTGFGTLGSFVLGIALLGETASAQRLIAAGLITLGLVVMTTSTSA